MTTKTVLIYRPARIRFIVRFLLYLFSQIEWFLVYVSATVLYRLQSKQSSPDDKTLNNSSLLRQHIRKYPRILIRFFTNSYNYSK